MIINNQQNDIIKSGLDSSKKATINQDKLAKLQYLLTQGLYSNPHSAIIVEWANNGVDSVVQSGKNPVENPVIVNITQSKLSVKDNGLGLNKEEFENVCMSYLSSTKESDNQAIGAFGIGLKSFMALNRSATFTCIKDGVELKYIAYQGTEFMEYDLLYEKPTEEQNGVTCEISVNGWSEFADFRDSAKEKLAYYDTVLLYIEDKLIENNIIRSEDWQYSALNQDNFIHLCLKDVYYAIDYSKLGINKIYIPIALRFNLDEGLQPTPSRESLIWNTHTINLVKEKIKKVSTWFVNKYNEQTPDEEELLQVFDKISCDKKIVKLADEEFHINDLLNYSTIKPKELKIKGVEIQKPEYYWDNRYHIFDEYTTVVDYIDGTWKTKRCSSLDYRNVLHNGTGIKLIEVSTTPSRKVKTYLLEKYKGKVKFITKTKERKLGKKNVPYHLRRECDYLYLLQLSLKPKSEWRRLIQEWQFVENQFKSLIIDEKNVETSKEFIEWELNYKEEQKLNRKLPTYQPKSNNYKRINKQEGDITIQIACSKEYGNGCKFVKKAVKVTDLNKLHKNTKALHIYFTEEEKEKAKEYYELLNAKYSICILSPREIKRLPKIKNFMSEKEFIESRPFCKIMSSIKYQKAIDDFDNTYRNVQSEVVENVLKKFNEQRNILREYTRKNGKDIPNNLLQDLKEIAKEKDLYDRSLDDVYNEFVKNINKYSFISCLQKPRTWDDEEVIKYTKLLNSMLLMKQKYNNFDDVDIEIKEKTPEVLIQETILEEELV